jgi:ribosomal protein S18 acetylase RimI-like enzyme
VSGHDVTASVLIRQFDTTRDVGSLRACVIDHQNFHRGIEPTWPDGGAIADDYMTYLHGQCAAHNGCVFMAYCGDDVAGFVCVVSTTRGEAPDDPAPYAWIQDIYVATPYRRQGVATMLMAEAERFARDNGAQVLRLGVLDGNEGARRFYEGHGFREYTHVLTKTLE